MKTYAIGDVHGMLVLLRRVLRWIDVDAGDEPARVIFLGDYIDRGPDSAGVVKLLMSGPENPRHKWVCLKGNHEVMLVAARRIDSAIPMWVNNGGRECLRSYADMYPNSPTQQVIPDVVFEWIENLPILYTDSKRVYVHAALDPDSPLDQQTETFALWGRLDEKEYVGCEHLAGKLLVHGHTPRMRGPDYVPGAAINLDTGACFKGRLSCAAWDDGAEHPRVYQIGKYADGVKHWDASAYLKGKRGWVAPLTEMQQRINDSLGIVE